MTGRNEQRPVSGGRERTGERFCPAKARVTHLILDMGFGGAEKLVQDLATSLPGGWIESNIICFDAITRNTEPLEASGVSIELIRRNPAAVDLATCGRVIRRLRALKPRLLHAHDMSSLLYAATAGLVLGIPVVMTEHSRHYIEERLVRRLEKRLLCRGVRRLVEVSPELARASVCRDGIPSGKVVVIENGVDLERFASADGRGVRSALGLGPEDLLVGMVGRLEEIKGPGVLLEAFASVAREVPNARLAFVGDGSLARALRERRESLGLADRVEFLGARADIPEFMAGLDVLVLPSLSEGLPFALLEGMAAGRAVLATAVGRIPGIIREKGEDANGALAAPGDPASLARKLADLLRDGPRRRQVGLRARRSVARHYDKRAMLRGYEAVYAETLAVGGRP